MPSLKTTRAFFSSAVTVSLTLGSWSVVAQTPPSPSPPEGPRPTPSTSSKPTPSESSTPKTQPSAVPPQAPSSGPSPEELAAARDLWTRGLELERAKDWASARATFEQVGKVRMTPQVRYHIGLASEQLGRLVDALNAYQLALQEAQQLGDRARDVLENTPPRVEALRSRVGKLRLTITGTLRTSKIYLDGRTISAALLDHDIPVDPGRHSIEARRDGEVIDRVGLSISEGTIEAVVLKVDDPKPKKMDSKPPEPTEAKVGSSRFERWPAVATAAGGVALLATGGVFWALRGSTIDTIRETCRAGDVGCDPTFEPTEELGRTYTTAGRVLFGVGAAAVATGVTLWFVLPTHSEGDEPGAAKPSLGLTPTPEGVLLRGTF